MLFSLDEIKNILASGSDDSDALSFLEENKVKLENKIREMKEAQLSIERLIKNEKEAKKLLEQNSYHIEEKTLPPVLIVGIRKIGKYSECGELFARLGRSLGWNISGKPFNLYYDKEYKEDGADFESCYPVKKEKEVTGATTRTLSEQRAVCLLYKGPYEHIGPAYAKVFSYINEKGLKPNAPSREMYIKAPGMIFKGNPATYLTEIQIPLR